MSSRLTPLLLCCALLLPLHSYATIEGQEVEPTGYYPPPPPQTWTQPRQGSGGLYVCYTRRASWQARSGRIMARYYGCTRSYQPCRSMDMYHFGKYSNNYKARNALSRCLSSTPRFID